LLVGVRRFWYQGIAWNFEFVEEDYDYDVFFENIQALDCSKTDYSSRQKFQVVEEAMGLLTRADVPNLDVAMRQATKNLTDHLLRKVQLMGDALCKGTVGEKATSTLTRLRDCWATGKNTLEDWQWDIFRRPASKEIERRRNSRKELGYLSTSR
jgi:hypothetical protein